MDDDVVCQVKDKGATRGVRNDQGEYLGIYGTGSHSNGHQIETLMERADHKSVWDLLTPEMVLFLRGSWHPEE